MVIERDTDVVAEVDRAVMDEGLAYLAANRDRPYYDAAADADAASQYYTAIDATASGDDLMRAVQTLVTRTHSHTPHYKPTVMVYPWVDLHPDRQLRSIYSGKSFDPEDMIRDDARIEAERKLRLRDLVTREPAIGPDVFTSALDELDAQLPYNCEHAVPQSSFAKREPMRGDLHHLFTCESRCNSFRSNTPYFDFGDDERAVMQDCGRSEPDRFEPRAGKGAVARATNPASYKQNGCPS
jgi:endonuclease I